MSVDAVVYYRVSNATVSVANVEDCHPSTRLLAQTTLRNILGTKDLHQILSDRESISTSMQVVLDEATGSWGIKVERVEIKDARLPVMLQRAMAAEAEAAREARAKVIAAEGEQKASRALREASEVLCESSAALQLRYLQTLNSVSSEKNSTVIFPLPMDILNSYLTKKDKKEKEEAPRNLRRRSGGPDTGQGTKGGATSTSGGLTSLSPGLAPAGHMLLDDHDAEVRIRVQGPTPQSSMQSKDSLETHLETPPTLSLDLPLHPDKTKED